jgi:eukaryotic-like serine/threonine-protein kinase
MTPETVERSASGVGLSVMPKSENMPEQESSVQREERLAVVLDQLLSGQERTDPGKALAAAVALHPDLKDDLRALFATALIADDVALLQSDDDHGALTPDGLQKASDHSLRSASVAGTQIGDYVLREQIGRGGMGVVYRAWQGKLQRTVALKMIPNAEFARSTDMARLRVEAMAAAGLSHPNIVPVYEVGEFGGQPWFSMQFIDGDTLSERLASGPLSPRAAVEFLIPVVEAIGSAHRAGILHRDIKPSNILIESSGKPWVTDFGLAKRVTSAEMSNSPNGSQADVEQLTHSGAVLGTPAWMSPEQAAGRSEFIDVRTDIYSLGAVLYAMLTGRPPFHSASPLDTLRMVMEQDPPAIRMLNASVDPDLEMVVLKCLQKPTDLRYESADAMAADLRAWLVGEPVSARLSTFRHIMTRLFRESHQAAVLQNWGLLWMWHSLVLLILCVVTNAFQLAGETRRWPYVTMWVLGLGLWAAIFWNLRHRAGPITAVERQIAHLWGGCMLASIALFAVESIMNRPVLEMSPVLGVVAGIMFLVKAGMLSGSFYVHSIVMFSVAGVMAAIQHSNLPNFSLTLYGVVAGLTFFLPGLKYYRQQKQRKPSVQAS